MRLLILVFGVFCLASAAAASEVRGVVRGGNLPFLSEKKAELEVAWKKPRFHCTKKIVIGADKNEIACLMTRRNAFASAPVGEVPQPPKREADAREQKRKPARRR